MQTLGIDDHVVSFIGPTNSIYGGAIDITQGKCQDLEAAASVRVAAEPDATWRMFQKPYLFLSKVCEKIIGSHRYYRCCSKRITECTAER